MAIHHWIDEFDIQERGQGWIHTLGSQYHEVLEEDEMSNDCRKRKKMRFRTVLHGTSMQIWSRGENRSGD